MGIECASSLNAVCVYLKLGEAPAELFILCQIFEEIVVCIKCHSDA